MEGLHKCPLTHPRQKLASGDRKGFFSEALVLNAWINTNELGSRFNKG